MSSKRTKQTRRVLAVRRPRLIQRLDEAGAPTIAIVAPAGYGKTTLARQWTTGMSRVAWYSATESAQDVAAFAVDIARAVAGDGSKVTYIRELLSSLENPQRHPDELVHAMYDLIVSARPNLLVLDDYHLLRDSPHAAGLVNELRRKADQRLLIISRVRPRWASARDRLYGDVVEIVR